MNDEEIASYDLATRQIVTLNGFEYDVRQLCGLLDTGFDLKAAIKQLYDTLPADSVPKVAAKVKKHPYYVARQDLQLNIIKSKGAELQQNLLDIAFEGKSERNRLEATNSALDRVYGGTDDTANTGPAKPTMVFNFSFGATPVKPTSVTVTNESDDLEVIDA